MTDQQRDNLRAELVGVAPPKGVTRRAIVRLNAKLARLNAKLARRAEGHAAACARIRAEAVALAPTPVSAVHPHILGWHRDDFLRIIDRIAQEGK